MGTRKNLSPDGNTNAGMKKSTVIGLCLGTFALGFIVGLFWAAYKGPPPMSGPGGPHQAATQETETVPPRASRLKLEALEKQIKAAPDNIKLHVKAGNLLFDNERYKDAVKFYEKALELGSLDPNVLNDVGICYRRLGNPKKAVAYLHRARKADPGHQNSALNLGIVLLHDLQDKEGAIKAWREYLALGPQGPRAEMIRRVMAQLESRSGD